MSELNKKTVLAAEKSTATADHDPDYDAYDHLLIGRTIREFSFVKRLGRGGMGRVYLVEKENDELTLAATKRYALKILTARSIDSIKILHDEASFLFGLEHDNIVELHKAGFLDIPKPSSSKPTKGLQIPYLLMEYCDGTDLGKLIRSMGSASNVQFPLKLQIAKQITQAIRFLHSAGIIHRDIKPGNAIVIFPQGDSDKNCTVKVVDFGLAKFLRATTPEAQAMSDTVPGGTAQYAPPEFFKALPVDEKTDIYSCGILLYELFAGKAPFTAPDNLRLDEKYEYYRECHSDKQPPSLHLHGNYPSTLLNLVSQMVSKEPADRPTINEVVDRVRQIMIDHGLTTSSKAYTFSSAIHVTVETKNIPHNLEAFKNDVNAVSDEPITDDRLCDPEVPLNGPPEQTAPSLTKQRAEQTALSESNFKHRSLMRQLWVRSLLGVALATMAGSIFFITKTKYANRKKLPAIVTSQPSTPPPVLSVPVTAPQNHATPATVVVMAGPNKAASGRQVVSKPVVQPGNVTKVQDIPMIAVTASFLPAGLNPFRIGQTEVTAAQYMKCVEHGGCPVRAKILDQRKTEGCIVKLSKSYSPLFDAKTLGDYPINCISIENAKTYCAWLGQRLPKLNEWLAAAKSSTANHYSWGKIWDDSIAVCGGPGKRHFMPCKTGSSSSDKTALQILDLTGNLSEFVDEKLDSKNWCFVGGNWNRNSARKMYLGERHGVESNVGQTTVGFRCVMEL